MMTELSKKKRRTRIAINACDIARHYTYYSFAKVVINGKGQCGGCYDPDTHEIENKCRTCKHCERYIAC